MERVKKPINPLTEIIAREGNPEGPLYGETAVFTGALGIPRREAAQLAADAGCQVADAVNKATTLLVVGDQDIQRLNGQEKSSKHRKAEELILKGQGIRILGESDFQRLVGFTSEPPILKEKQEPKGDTRKGYAIEVDLGEIIKRVLEGD